MAASSQSAAVEIIRTLRARGHQAFLVGGCVRDLVLGREPADFDVSTDATPDQVMRIFPKTWAVGAQFGVVLVPVNSLLPETARPPESAAAIDHRPSASSADDRRPTTDGSRTIEVATFRSDGLYTDGRHPDEVTYTRDPREDVQRRDFTING